MPTVSATTPATTTPAPSGMATSGGGWGAASAGISMVGTGIAAFYGYKAAKSAAEAQAIAIRAQGNYQAQMLEMNAQFADLSAKDAVIRGDRAIGELGQQTRRLIGSQRAALAAQGIDVNRDDALEIQSDTAGMAAYDEMTIKNNAWREAWGFKVQAQETRNQAAWTKLQAKFGASTSLLSGGMQAWNYVGQAGGSIARVGGDYLNQREYQRTVSKTESGTRKG